MRPHIELIHEDDYVWHDAELPLGSGTARQRNLSVDEEDGSASTSVHFVTDWGRPPGRHMADTEWFVLEGMISVGGEECGKGTYVRAARKAAMPRLRAKAGTRILLLREHGDWGFEETDETAGRDELVLVNSDEMSWERRQTEGRPAGLNVKTLYRNKKTGFHTRLVWAEPGWSSHRLGHHPVWEEAYTLSGRMSYNYGELIPGTYLFRPAYVIHGEFASVGTDGCSWLIRTEGDNPVFFTEGRRIAVKGQAENYDPHSDGPVIAGLPVRSRSVGEWDGKGR